MNIKEGTWDEHWVLYVSDKSLNSTPETNIALYANQSLNKTLRQTKRAWALEAADLSSNPVLYNLFLLSKSIFLGIKEGY